MGKGLKLFFIIQSEDKHYFVARLVIDTLVVIVTISLLKCVNTCLLTIFINLRITYQVNNLQIEKKYLFLNFAELLCRKILFNVQIIHVT